jgi:hypothetical protein
MERIMKIIVIVAIGALLGWWDIRSSDHGVRAGLIALVTGGALVWQVASMALEAKDRKRLEAYQREHQSTYPKRKYDEPKDEH